MNKITWLKTLILELRIIGFAIWLLHIYLLRVISKPQALHLYVKGFGIFVMHS